MKVLLIITILTVPAATLLAQDDDTIRFVHGLPITGEDTAQQVPQPDVAPFDKFVIVSPAELPSGLATELDKNDLMKNWRSDARIEFDRNTGVYWINFAAGGRLRSYGYNADGNPVSIKEKAVPDSVNRKR